MFTDSDSNITYHEDKTITCKVEGGLPPHQVDLFLGNKGEPIIFIRGPSRHCFYIVFPNPCHVMYG